MVFENNLDPDPSLRDQLLNHLPIALLVLAVLATFVAMHTAITWLLAAGLAHALIGVMLLAIRRHRRTAGPESQQ